MEVTYDDVALAHKRIRPYARRTPVLTSKRRAPTGRKW
jgi:threonine dehydratase